MNIFEHLLLTIEKEFFWQVLFLIPIVNFSLKQLNDKLQTLLTIEDSHNLDRLSMLVGEVEGVNRVENFFKLQIFNLICIIERIKEYNSSMFRKNIKKYISSDNDL